MLDVFNTPVPQNANYQEFYGGGTVRDWVKPRGASMMRILLIGPGGGGCGGSTGNNGYTGGGSGAVTSWIGPAIFVPDVLRISIGAGGAGGAGTTSTSSNAGSAGGTTSVIYQVKDGTGYTLLTANGGSGGPTTNVGGAGATASSETSFSCSGIYTSIAGQNGADRTLGITASTTTFLSGGAGANNNLGTAGLSVATNYGYPTISGGAAGVGSSSNGGPGGDGFFITQPIMLGTGGAGGGSGATSLVTLGGRGGNGGIGCGGGAGGKSDNLTGGSGGRGGDGAVFIWTW